MGSITRVGQAGRWLRRGLLALPVAALAALDIITIWFLWTKWQFLDFRSYYRAAGFLNDHSSPYTRLVHVPPFVYTPLSLMFLKCFTVYLEFHAHRQWLLVKCLAGILLVITLHRHFRIRLGLSDWLLICGGFTFTVMQDLIHGNVSLIEQLLLWAGFAAMLHRRYVLFGLCLVAAAQFKLTIIMLLPCVFLIDGDRDERRRQWMALTAGLGMFAGGLAANFLIWPRWPQEVRANLAAIDYDGATSDPAFRAFVVDAVHGVSRGASWGMPAATVLYVLLAGGILAGSGWALWTRHRREGKLDTLLGVMFACVVYALILPRLKSYSYILVIPPAMFLLSRARGWKASAILALCMLPTHNLIFPFPVVPLTIAHTYDAAHVPPLISNYTSLFALIAIWIWYLGELVGSPSDAADTSRGKASGCEQGRQDLEAAVRLSAASAGPQ